MSHAKSGRCKKGFVKSLYTSYGGQDLYNSGHFNPMIRNLSTGKLSSRCHHCDQCNKKLVQSCYDSLHHAFCPIWVTRKYRGLAVRERCGERFTIRSDGCGKHPRVQGYNKPLLRAAEGGQVELSEFEDDLVRFEKETESDSDEYSKEQNELEGLAERVIAECSFLPENFYDHYWQYRAQKQEHARQNKNKTVRSDSKGAGELMARPGRGQKDVVMNGNVKSSRNWEGNKTFLSRLPKDISFEAAKLHEQARETEDEEDIKSRPDIVTLTVKERIADWWTKYQQE